MEAGSYFTVHQDSDETPSAPAPGILVGPKAAVPTDVFLSKRPPKSGGALCHIHASPGYRNLLLSLYQTQIQKSLWVFLRLHF